MTEVKTGYASRLELERDQWRARAEKAERREVTLRLLNDQLVDENATVQSLRADLERVELFLRLDLDQARKRIAELEGK